MSQSGRVLQNAGTLSTASLLTTVLAGSGALTLVQESEIVLLNTTAASTVALPAASNVGKRVSFIGNSIVGNCVITPSTFVGHSTATITATGQAVTLVYTGSAGWAMLSNNGATIA